MIKFIKLLFIKIFLSLFFIVNINLIFASENPQVNIQASQIGSGVAMVPAEIGSVILIVFVFAIYYHKRRIDQTKVHSFN